MSTQLPIIITIVINTNNKLGIKMFPRNIEFSSLQEWIVFADKYIFFIRRKIEIVLNKLKKKKLDFSDVKKVVWSFQTSSVEICWEDVSMKKNSGMFEISIAIKKIDFIGILNDVIKILDNEIAVDILKVIVENIGEKSVYELLDFLLAWINKNNITNSVVDKLLSKNDRVKKVIDKYEIEISDVRIGVLEELWNE